jgi:ketol-acid reductoisomerase
VREERAELWNWLEGQTLGVLGYGNQGRAQALNLRDTSTEYGFQVLVGTRRGGKGEERARRDGFESIAPRDLAGRCGILISLLPDEVQAEVLSREIFSGTGGESSPTLLCLAHGFSLVYGGLIPPSPWDVVLVAPTGPGQLLREEYLAGRGLPGLVAVHQDATGNATSRALALAQALGLLRAGVYLTSVRDETVVDLFGEQAVLCGGLVALCLAAFDTLVERGYPPELAYIECVQQIGVTSDLLARFGPAGFRERISGTALYGDLTRGPKIINDQVRRNLADILNEIATGRFGREWMDEVNGGRKRLRQLMEEARRHPSNEVFQKLPRHEP